MSTIALLSHPDRVHRMDRTGQLHAAGEALIGDDGMPINTLGHWQRLDAQTRLIIQTSTALETQLVETDLDQAVMADKIGTTAPFYCAFARYGRHHSLLPFEGAYIDPVGRKAIGQIQVAYIASSRKATRLEWSRDEINAARIERIAFSEDMPVRNHPDAATRIAGQTNSAMFDAARSQILRIMLAMRFDNLDRRKHPAEPAPWNARFVSRFDVLEIGPDDLQYGIDDRAVVPGAQGIHHFERGRFTTRNGRLGWRRPRLSLIDRSDLQPANTAGTQHFD
ncbi:hypothetical protein J7355_13595 [Endozoicomonas sp. G2_2]|uniref:hypothetical protein n=1 Tax=Endozoicomonas sp. G2_2 TaxID=2821092 RepID=UPI001ADCF388|nr:hypothetical protein [Endozoicomonas sp. G2_2]MBO9471130.1 hypothetical protein [Endozoicomonas sp. G2_2]